MPALHFLHTPLPLHTPSSWQEDAGICAHSFLTSSPTWFWQALDTHFWQRGHSELWQQALWAMHCPLQSLNPERQTVVEHVLFWQLKLPGQSVSVQHPPLGMQPAPQGCMLAAQL